MKDPLELHLEDRLRLAGALLAAGTWPEQEQKITPHKPHHVAESARRYLAPHSAHPAVQYAQQLVNAGSGLTDLFTRAFQADWPREQIEVLDDFVYQARLMDFWMETQIEWMQAASDASDVLSNVGIATLMTTFFGTQARPLTIMPNLLFPALRPVVIGTAAEIVVCVPPPLAWGTSSPWRYRERPDQVLAATGTALGQFLFADSLPAEEAALQPCAAAFGVAVAVLLLRQSEGDEAAHQFMVMEKKTRQWPSLPALVTALADGLNANADGESTTLADYLPFIRHQLVDVIPI